MIRRFREDDTTKVMTIWTKGNFKAHYFIDKDYWLENFNRVKNEYLLKSETYIYVEDDEIKGFISLLDGGYIGALFVREDSKRKGIGRRLINYCRDRYDRLTLNVYEKNIDATLFYVAMGFKNKRIQIDEHTRRKRVYYGVETENKNWIKNKTAILTSITVFIMVN